MNDLPAHNLRSFKTESTGGVFVTVTIPAQRILQTVPRYTRDLPPVTIKVFLESGQLDERAKALWNALELLEVLYERGVTSPEVLGVLLEATGHRLPPANSKALRFGGEEGAA